MNLKYDYLKGIREAIEQRLGRTLDEMEFQLLLIRGDGKFWDLNGNSGGIRLYDPNALKTS